jgi:hypothetical protein
MVQAAANYMFVFIYANKRTYIRTLRIHAHRAPWPASRGASDGSGRYGLGGPFPLRTLHIDDLLLPRFPSTPLHSTQVYGSSQSTIWTALSTVRLNTSNL